MRNMACVRRLAWVVLLGLLTAGPALASPITWTLTGVQLSGIDGGPVQATGWFIFDGTTVSSWNIQMSAAGIFPAISLTNANSTVYYNSVGTVNFHKAYTAAAGEAYLDLGYFNFFGDEPGLSAPGTMAYNSDPYNLTGTEDYTTPDVYTYSALMTGGELVGTAAAGAVPEPATGALTLTGGLMLLGLAWRRGVAAKN